MVITTFYEMKNELLKFLNNKDPTSDFVTQLRLLDHPIFVVLGK